MRSALVHVQLVLALTAGLGMALADASQFSRDESKEDSNTQFNLASTFKGGISTNRHHERAHLDSQLYPDMRQQLPRQTEDIDSVSAHESGGAGSGLGTLNVPAFGISPAQPPLPSVYPVLPNVGAAQPNVGYPVPSMPASCGLPRGGAPNTASTPCAAQPQIPAAIPPSGTAYPAGVYPSYGPQQPGFVTPPGYPYPGQYLPQYPSYPQAAPFPYYGNYGPNPPVITHPGAPATSYQNQQSYPGYGGQRPHDRVKQTFKMNTEYKEDGTHRGPFEVLNNHGSQGYGSGFGGGYNGIFQRPGY